MQRGGALCPQDPSPRTVGADRGQPHTRQTASRCVVCPGEEGHTKGRGPQRGRGAGWGGSAVRGGQGPGETDVSGSEGRGCGSSSSAEAGTHRGLHRLRGPRGLSRASGGAGRRERGEGGADGRGRVPRETSCRLGRPPHPRPGAGGEGAGREGLRPPGVGRTPASEPASAPNLLLFPGGVSCVEGKQSTAERFCLTLLTL